VPGLTTSETKGYYYVGSYVLLPIDLISIRLAILINLGNLSDLNGGVSYLGDSISFLVDSNDYSFDF